MRRPGSPDASPGMPAPKRGTSSASVQTHLCLSGILLGQEDRHSGETQSPPQDHSNDLSVAGLKRGGVCRRIGPLVEDALVPNRPTFIRNGSVGVDFRNPGERHT